MSDSVNQLKTLEPKDLKTPQLIGRNAIIAEVQALFEQAQQGIPLFLLLNGEQGIGKSRICHEIQERAKDSVFLHEDCQQDDEYQPFIRTIHFLYQIYNKLGVLAKSDYVGKFPPMLSADFVEFAVSGLNEHNLVDVFEQVECNVDNIFDCTSSYVRSHAHRQHYIWIIDHLHWIDRRSGDWLYHLTSHLESGDKLLIIGMYQGDQASGENNFQRILPRFRNSSNFKELKIPPILARETIPFIRSMLAPIQIDQVEIMPVYKVARGNPHLLIEFVKGLAEDKKIVWQDNAWNLQISDDILTRPPKAVEDLLIKNFPDLGHHHRHILEWFAIATLGLDHESIATLIGLKAIQLPYILGDLLKERYIYEEESNGNKVFAISSQNVANEIVHGLDEQRVLKMHVQLARLLDKKRSHDEMLLKAADHFHYGEEWRRSMAISLEAARWLMAQKRFSLALRYYRRAVLAAEKRKKPGPLGEILCEFAMALYRLGDHKNALINFEQAEAMKPKLAILLEIKKGKIFAFYGLRKYDLANKELRSYTLQQQESDIELLLIQSALEIHHYGIKKAGEYIEQARQLLAKKPEDILMPRLKQNEGWLAFYQGKWPEAHAAFQQAEQHYTEIQNDQGVMETLVGKTWLLAASEGPICAWETLLPVLFYNQENEDFYLQFHGSYQAGMFTLEQGNLDKAQEYFQQIELITRKKGADREGGYAVLGQALCAFYRKDAPEDIEKIAQQAMERATNFNDPNLGAETYHLLARLYLRMQVLSKVQQYLDYSKEAFLRLEMKWRVNRLFADYARMLTLAKNGKQALLFLAKGENNAIKIGDQYHLADNHFAKGFLLARNRQFSEASSWFAKAEELYRKLGRRINAFDAKKHREQCESKSQP